MKKTIALLMMAAMIFGLLMTACGKDAGNDAGNDSAENLTLTIGVMPAVDSAPIFLAAEKGYFDELGLTVDVQIYTNAMNRQSALLTGELDGAMTDVIALINNVDNGFDIKVTTSTDGSFPFLMNKNMPDELDAALYNAENKLKVGLMEVSVTNYVSDRSLEGFDIEKVYINEIPARLEMVAKGELDLAVIPEPMASQGEANGLKKLHIENKDEYSPEVMVFLGNVIESKEKAIELFHQAYNKAVEEINTDDSEARDLLISKLSLKPEIKENIIMPVYNKARVPSEEYLRGVMDWNEKVLGKKVDLSYKELVEGKFVND